jgi:putative ABC transport system permease protein
MAVSAQLPRLFLWQTFRHAMRHRLLAFLNILGVALGIAVFVAIRTVNESATRSLTAGVELVAGKADLEIRGNIPEELLPAVSRVPGVAAATPLVEQAVALPGHPGMFLRLTGVDPFTNASFRTFTIRPVGSEAGGMEEWLSDPARIAIPESLRKELKLSRSGTLSVTTASGQHPLRVGGTFETDLDHAGSRYAAMDIGWAQELLGLQGQLTSILIQVESGEPADAVAQRINSVLPPHLRTHRPAQRSAQLDEMLHSFRLNLNALSLVSLLVGAFLIHNTIAASVVRSRTEIGILRAIGASQWDIRCLFLGEALLYGIIGSCLGIVAGYAGASLLLREVSRTISSLYLLTAVEHVVLAPLVAGTALFLGLACVLVAAWMPAAEAANTHPSQVLASGRVGAERPPSQMPLWTALALLASAIGMGALARLSGPPILGFASAFFLLTGMAALATPAIRLTSWIAGQFHMHSLIRMSLDNLARATRRNGITLAALAAAIAMMTGLTVMIHSFRSAVDAWITGSMSADIFAAPAANEVVGLQNFVQPELIAALREDPRIISISTYREITL